MTQFSERYRTHELSKRAAAVMAGGVTRGTVYLPEGSPFATSAGGFTVTDQFGHTAIDACNNYTALIHGHNHADTAAAASLAISHGSAMSLRTQSEVELAELLRARTGQPFWRFSNSGTEAVMSAVRAARAFTDRNLIVKFAGSYHGTANDVAPDGALGLPHNRDREVIECVPGSVDAIAKIFDDHPSQIAAVILDLMPNRAGLVPAESEYVYELAELTRQAGALLIVDEVISLRIGPGGLAASYGITPDLITAGKIIGGGFPIGAIGGREDVLDVFNPARQKRVDWGGTFSANPVSMSAGLATMRAFSPQVQSALDSHGDALRRTLSEAGVTLSGRGSLSRITDTRFNSAAWWACYERGALLGTNGLLCLSTPMTTEAIEQLADAVVAGVTGTG